MLAHRIFAISMAFLFISSAPCLADEIPKPWKVTYSIIGGVAGFMEGISVSSDGQFKFEDLRTGKAETLSVDTETTQAILKQVEEAHLLYHPSSGESSHYPDHMTRTFTVTVAGIKKREFQVSDKVSAGPLGRLTEALGKLIIDYRKQTAPQ